MAFYDLTKEEHRVLVEKINRKIAHDLSSGTAKNLIGYFSDEDTYIRKTGYLAIGKLFYAQAELQHVVGF
jgi:uncharacterized protein YoaH (UPF0181 family)